MRYKEKLRAINSNTTAVHTLVILLYCQMKKKRESEPNKSVTERESSDKSNYSTNKEKHRIPFYQTPY